MPGSRGLHANSSNDRRGRQPEPAGNPPAAHQRAPPHSNGDSESCQLCQLPDFIQDFYRTYTVFVWPPTGLYPDPGLFRLVIMAGVSAVEAGTVDNPASSITHNSGNHLFLLRKTIRENGTIGTVYSIFYGNCTSLLFSGPHPSARIEKGAD